MKHTKLVECEKGTTGSIEGDVAKNEAMAEKSQKYYYPKKNNNLTYNGRSVKV